MALHHDRVVIAADDSQDGLTAARVKSAASTNATNIKAAAGLLGGYTFYNTTVSPKYVKLYNKASAPTVGTDTPFMTLPIPANGGREISFAIPITMSVGISYAITGGVADTDTAAVAVDDVTGAIFYV